MPRRSVVLDHPQRQRIDELIRAGEPRSAIARELDVSPEAVKRYARRLLADQVPPTAAKVVMDPLDTFIAAFGFEPTDYQASYLSDQRPTVVLKSRQSGFTQAAASLAIWTARSRPGADAVIVSPSLQQSKEVTTRARAGLYELEETLVQDAVSLLRLKNASRIISLPGNARAVRGYAPALVVADEAAWIEDPTYDALRPLLAASKGRLVAQSTPGARVGWFFDLWESELDDQWLRLEVPASSVPFIDADFLERERRELANRPGVFEAEYECTFGAALGGFKLFDMTDYDDRFVDYPEAS